MAEKKKGSTTEIVRALAEPLAKELGLIIWDVTRHTKRVRFSGTEESPELYADPRKHFYAFLRGVLLFLAVALINGYLLTWI